jgi:hypothetical protein
MLYPENSCSTSTPIEPMAPIKANVDALIQVLPKPAITPF